MVWGNEAHFVRTGIPYFPYCIRDDDERHVFPVVWTTKYLYVATNLLNCKMVYVRVQRLCTENGLSLSCLCCERNRSVWEKYFLHAAIAFIVVKPRNPGKVNCCPQMSSYCQLQLPNEARVQYIGAAVFSKFISHVIFWNFVVCFCTYLTVSATPLAATYSSCQVWLSQVT